MQGSKIDPRMIRKVDVIQIKLSRVKDYRWINDVLDRMTLEERVEIVRIAESFYLALLQRRKSERHVVSILGILELLVKLGIYLTRGKIPYELSYFCEGQRNREICDADRSCEEEL